MNEADWKLPWEGGCRCGATRVRVTRPPLVTMACHCTGCQRMSASAFSLSIALPAEGFEVTQGEPILGGLKREHRHYFCPSCLSWMFTRPGGIEWLVNLRGPVLDDHQWVDAFIETWTSEKVAWAATSARHSFETVPDASLFEPLMAQYAAEGARPA